MPTILEEKRLILCDAGNNNNKFWYATLYDNDDVLLEWGRVGKGKQKKLKEKAGKKYYDSKVRGQYKDGYTDLKTIAVDSTKTTAVVVENRDLASVAKSEIKVSSPELQKLVDRLVKANIHHITSTSQIAYNASTGLFTTPLGIVTQEGIDEARKLLVDIKKAEHSTTEIQRMASLYLRIIPQDIGMKFDVNRLFGDDDKLRKQGDLLDSLESSYLALKSTPTTQDANAPKKDAIFNVQLDIVDTGKEIDRIVRKFRDTKKSMHACSNLNVKKVYMVNINHVRTAFLERGQKIGNVMELWHGTKKANLLSILKTGLKISPPSTAYISGKMFGNGLYFSDQSTKSLNYAYGYWDGNYEKNCFMFLCDVAMGKPYIPSGGWRTSVPPSGYDSTYAEAGRSGVMNNEMIVYKEHQCDLKYLIEFE